MTTESIRLSIFLGLLICFAIVEKLHAKRTRPIPRSQRWPQNLLLTAIAGLISRFTLGSAPMAVAYYCQEKEIGLLPWLGLGGGVALILTVIFMDCAIYFQHRLFHSVPSLWRLHKVHHSDIDLDVTSGFRFHPLEILVSLAIKTSVVFLLGASADGILVFEILLNAGSLFNHSNISIPPFIDKVLRLFIVTPDVHIIHHSVHPHETHSNFAFTISAWDRLFGTYRRDPQDSHDGITIGLPVYRQGEVLTLTYLMGMPFRTEDSQGRPPKAS